MADNGTTRPVRLRGRLDLASCAGVVIAAGGILGGLIMEGGKLSDVSQITAAMIVLGGTLGAVMLTTPVSTLVSAARKLPLVFYEKSHDPQAVTDAIIGLATKARRSGIISLEQDSETISDPFMKKALDLAVDGMDLGELRAMMELEINAEEHLGEEDARVYEAAGGYAPTIGIIGAVIGLIQVMKNLANIEEVGKGIAVAFVATVYGVGAANVLFLPAAAKIKARLRTTIRTREQVLEGVVGIVEGLNPKLIRCKLEAYRRQETSSAKPRLKDASQARMTADGRS
jgi:chemotaxis protein MotA